MAARTPRIDRFINVNQARVEQGAHLSGIAGAFGAAADLGPQVRELQLALFAGMVSSQGREAERLAARYEKGDPRVDDAFERARDFEALAAEANLHLQDVERFVEALQQPGTFSGYVMQPDGTPAEGFGVRVAVTDVALKRTLRGTTKTDATGHFSLSLSSADTGSQSPAGTAIDSIIERISKVMTGGSDTPDDESDVAAKPDADASAHTNAQTNPDANPGAKPNAKPSPKATAAAPDVLSKVEVLDPNGRVVLEDPAPPTFDTLPSEFRYYVLTTAAPGVASTGRGPAPA